MKLLIAVLTSMSLHIQATEITEPSFRYTTDLSAAEHKQLILSRGLYDDCLVKEAKANINKHDDFRKVADVAMKACKTTLNDIDANLASMNLDPDFRRYFLRKISQKSAQKLLPELMVLKSR